MHQELLASYRTEGGSEVEVLSIGESGMLFQVSGRYGSFYTYPESSHSEVEWIPVSEIRAFGGTCTPEILKHGGYFARGRVL